ncbi:hypothetical protein ATO6_08340 [Oceanicola sp. 22II-s10i]|nr:hypothetical protein ATO6_08340 [Oceanicola sp. 22II-s10i]
MRGNDGPSEYPPASYKGTQYVDSKGCVYIRAGVGGTVTWVPRVARNRQVVCGYRPTFETAPRGTGPVVATEQVVVITPAQPENGAPPAAAPRVAAAPKPAPVTVKPVAAAQARPSMVPSKPAPVTTARRTGTTAAPAPRTEAVRVTSAPAAVRPAPRAVAVPGPTVTVPQGRAVCPANTQSTGQYVRRDGQLLLRCVRVKQAPQVVQGGGQRSYPAHVAAQRELNTVRTPVPKGYVKAFKDDRLNPRRAEGTAAGQRQMELVWTNTVPRRLVDRRTGKDVTALFPNFKNPFVSSSGSTVQGGAKAKQPVVSSRSAPRATATGHRYVQVGMFGEPGNATRAAQRLGASGLPVRYSTYSKGGKALKVVLAGPFADQAALNRALSVARKAGFRDAFTR